MAYFLQNNQGGTPCTRMRVTALEHMSMFKKLSSGKYKTRILCPQYSIFISKLEDFCSLHSENGYDNSIKVSICSCKTTAVRNVIIIH
jgi:hypothetical protein